MFTVTLGDDMQHVISIVGHMLRYVRVKLLVSFCHKHRKKCTNTSIVDTLKSSFFFSSKSGECGYICVQNQINTHIQIEDLFAISIVLWYRPHPQKMLIGAETSQRPVYI